MTEMKVSLLFAIQIPFRYFCFLQNPCISKGG